MSGKNVNELSGIIRDLLDPQAVLMTALFLLAVLWLVHIMGSNNPLEWWHYVASHGKDGQYYADIDKLGLIVGIFVGSLVVVIESYNGHLDQFVFAAYLAFVGGVKGYSAYLRSRQGGVETRRVTEPVSDPDTTRVTETRVEIPPVK